MEELSNFVFFRVIYDFIHSEIDEFAIDLLARTMALVSTAALSVLTLWILIRGYRIVTGQSHQPMLSLVVDALRTTLILGFACGMALGGSTLYEFLGSDLPNEISRVVTGDTAPINEQIDRSLAMMQIALGSIDALDVVGDTSLDSAKDRALWFAGLGTAGPAMSGGGLLLMNQIALALFIGLGPLFVLSLLFEQTKGLFGKWLYYGIGTMFSLAVLSVIVGIALDMVLKVAAAFWTSGVLMGSADGLTSLAMQQGCLGLVLTTLILSAPPMAAAFFNGVLGNFSPLSAFGGGDRRRESGHAVSSAHGASETDVPLQMLRRQPLGPPAYADEIKVSGDQLSPAVRPGIGSGMPTALLLPIDLQAVMALASKETSLTTTTPAPTNAGIVRFSRIDADGYLQDANITKRTVAGLEKGALSGPDAIVLHRTVSSTAASTLAAFGRGVGTHFIIDKDGTTYQTASLQKRTAHVGPIRSRCLVEGNCSPQEAASLQSYSPKEGHNHEKIKKYPVRYPMNEDSVGIEVVGMYWENTKQWDPPTAAQERAISRLVGLLQSHYSLSDSDIYEHDKISRKTAGEGAGLYDGFDIVSPIVSPRLPPP